MKSPNISYLLPVAIFLSLMFSVAGAQVPAGGGQPAASPTAVPGAYQSPVTNYVRTWTPRMPTTDPVAVTSPSRTITDVVQVTGYTDGLSRPLQTVVKGASGSGKDMVVPVIYDQYGRTPYQYLPYMQQSGNTNDGKFKNDPFNSQRNFYKDTVLSPSSKGESIYYSSVEFENRPASPAIKSFAPGNTWAKEGGGKSGQQYLFSNTVADSVRIWSVSSAGLPSTADTYPAGALFENQYKDQSGAQVVEYTNKTGQVVLRKTQLAASPGTAHAGWLCTYFVYDELGNLRVIIPPQAVSLASSTWDVSALIRGLCTLKRYDARGRNIVTKLPGADSIEVVFDPRDRPVMYRDGNMKVKQQWMVTYYDGLDRVIKTGLYSAGGTRSTMQAQVDAAPVGSFPFAPVGSIAIQTQIYYDDNYSFTGVQAAVTGDFLLPQSGTNPYPDVITGYSHRINGMVTGVSRLILGTNQWLTTTIYYNDRGRPIQTISDNINGGKTTTTGLYDYNGKLLSTYIRHTNPHSTVTPQTTMLTLYNYNASGNVTDVSVQLNDNTATLRTVGSYTYDESGNLKTSRLGVVGGVPKETLNYDYNIQGWLKGINKDFVATASSTSNWFGEDLSYDYGFSANQYNGGIAGAKWKSRGDGIARAFGYSYDNAGRILKADFTQQNQGSSIWTTDKVDFSVSNLGYDANGNITGLQQKGMKGLSIAVIDSLKFSYIPYTNQLFFVTDKNNDAQSKLGDFKEINNNESQDYAYDSSGNLTLDMNRLMSPNRYNYLNLPDSIMVLGQGVMEYTYDVLGTKLRKKVTDYSGSGSITTYDYIDGFVYKNDSLVYFPHQEGRIRATYATGKPVALVYDYFIADHLDNTRMVLTEETNLAAYAATMETAYSAKENALFSNIDNTRSAKPVGYPTDNTTSPNDYVAKLNAGSGTQKIGPSLVLRVMAGDTIQLGAKAFYKSAAASTSSTTVANMLTALLQAFSTGSGPSDGPHGNGTGAGSPLAVSFTSAGYQAIRDKDPSQNQASMPKAYLNYVLFDDLLNMVDENSGVRQVQGSPDQLQTLATSRMVMKKDGFFYVYTSNESVQDVFFDNIVVNHNNGPLLEETHYYPFGLTMAGISSRALKNPYSENRNNYNGIEQTAEIGLNQYDAFYRTLDPQIGRWWQMDPEADQYPGISAYSSNFNNPIYFGDLLGDDPGPGPQLLTLPDGSVGWGYAPITYVGQFVLQRAVENSLMNFSTNGFFQIPQIIQQQNDANRRYELNTIASVRAVPVETMQDQQFQMRGGFPIRKTEDLNATPQSWRNVMGAYNKSFKFVLNYVEPTVTTITGLGLESMFITGLTRGVAQAAVTSAVARNSLVQVNRTAGNLFRDELAAALRAAGREVRTEVYHATPFGKRFIDIEVWYKGLRMGGIETKVGASRYKTLQRLKDWYLETFNEFKVELVRKPENW